VESPQSMSLIPRRPVSDYLIGDPGMQRASRSSESAVQYGCFAPPPRCVMIRGSDVFLAVGPLSIRGSLVPGGGRPEISESSHQNARYGGMHVPDGAHFR
jgi:hypothetical protein